MGRQHCYGCVEVNCEGAWHDTNQATKRPYCYRAGSVSPNTMQAFKTAHTVHTVPDSTEWHYAPATEMKYDDGKVDMSLLEYFPNALKALCEVSMKGCEKYDRGSFTEVSDARRRYTAAMFRHYLDEGPGEEPKIDEELGLPHDFMVMWNAMVRVELRLLGHKLGK